MDSWAYCTGPIGSWQTKSQAYCLVVIILSACVNHVRGAYAFLDIFHSSFFLLSLVYLPVRNLPLLVIRKGIVKIKSLVRLCFVIAVLSAVMLSWSQNDAVGAPTTPHEISWQDLGLGERVRLQGSVASTDVFLHIPSGLTPTLLTGKLQLSPDVTSGFMEIRSRDQLIATFAVDAGTSNIDLMIPLKNSKLEGDILPLTFIARLRSIDDVCTTTYAGAWIEIEDIKVQFEGTPQAPQTVGEFFPSILHKVILVTSSQPTLGEAQAAINLAASLRHRYRHIGKFQIKMRPLNKDGALPIIADEDALFSRMIVIREGETNRVRVLHEGRHQNMPILEINGSAEEIREQSLWVVDRWGTAGQAEEINNLAFTAPQETYRDKVLLLELEPPTWNVAGMGKLEIPVTFSQGDLGGPVDRLGLRLAGHYTPLPSGAQATMSLFFNGGMIFATTFDRDGDFDHFVTIPNNLLQRDNKLTIQFLYTPAGGKCTLDAHPFEASLNKGSYFTVEFGVQKPIRFLHYPQILLPSFQIAFSSLTFTDLNAAVSIVSEWQRITRSPLHPQVVPWDQALSSNQPAVLIVHDSTQTDNLAAPVRLEPFRILDNQGKELLRFDTPVAFGLAETFTYNDRPTLLIATSPTVSAEKIAATIVEQPDGWYSLQGDLFLVTDEGKTVMLQVQEGGITIEPLAQTPQSWHSKWRLLLYPLILLLILLIAAWLHPRLVRPAPKKQ